MAGDTGKTNERQFLLDVQISSYLQSRLLGMLPMSGPGRSGLPLSARGKTASLEPKPEEFYRGSHRGEPWSLFLSLGLTSSLYSQEVVEMASPIFLSCL